MAPTPCIIWLIPAIGEEVRSRNLLPDAVSHSEMSPIEPSVATTRLSALNPASFAEPADSRARSSRPAFRSQILTTF